MTNTLKSAWLPLALTAVAMLALVGWLAAVGTAGAAVSSLGAGSGSAEPGGTVSVDIVAEASSPGIGAYEVQVAVGGTAVASVTCTKSANSAFDLAVCNANFDQDDGTVGPVFFTGASTSGATGTVILGTITATCGSAEGSSTLTVTVNKLSDPSAADISVSPSNGSIDCEVPATAAPTDTPAPGTATAAPTAAATTPATLPKTGGSQGGSSSLDSTMFVVAALGLIVVAGGAWSVARARREV